MPDAKRDDLLAEIQRIYWEEMPLLSNHRETPEYRAVIKRIRALVDERTKLRGDEMIVVSESLDAYNSKD